MIKTDNLQYTYENSIEGQALKDVNTSISEGQIVMLCGESGSGKTTFIRAVNGLLSHYYEGEVTGTILVDKKDVNETKLHNLANIVGSVFQNPKSQFYTLTTDTEIVFGCENIGIERDEILTRFDSVVSSFHIEDLLNRNLFTLSGGEKQKIACASVACLKPKVFVLDEPTSNLDIKSINELRGIIETWKNQGHTVLIAEHRLTWLKDIADRVIYFKEGKIALDTDAKTFWNIERSEMNEMGLRAPIAFTPKCIKEHNEDNTIEIKNMSLRKKKHEILHINNLSIPTSSVIAILGNCGEGKTTFARSFSGLEKKLKCTISINGKLLKNKDRVKKCYMVMQDVNHQLFTSTVKEELMLGLDLDNELAQKTSLDYLLEEMDIVKYKDAHPMALSGGQKQRVAIASALASDKDIIFYDEPTSGLDFRHMSEISESILKLSEKGKTQFVITHDPELVERCCDYFIFMEDGDVSFSGGWTDENIEKIRSFFKINLGQKYH